MFQRFENVRDFGIRIRDYIGIFVAMGAMGKSPGRRRKSLRG
jgi:hypothetical protein